MRSPTAAALLISIPFLAGAQAVPSPADIVDPRIGVLDGWSNCVIGPQLPFGSINPSPHTPDGSHDGYHPERKIRGFGQLHASGTGWGSYGQILVSPQTGLSVGEEAHDSAKAAETARAYEYGVTLKRYGIRAEVVPAAHAALYRFEFPRTGEANVLIDLTHNIPMDIAKVVGGAVRRGEVAIDASRSRISGWGAYEGGFGGGEYRVHFIAEFSEAPASWGPWLNGAVHEGSAGESIRSADDRVGAYLGFGRGKKRTVLLRIAVSLLSVERAEAWLAKEIPDWDYARVRGAARDAWNARLGRVRVDGAAERERRLFYTALYHAMLMPRDRTDDLPGFGPGVPAWDDHYAVWDTWRTAFPLMSLLCPDAAAGNVNSFIARLELNGRVKDAFIAGTDKPEDQGGDDVGNVIADAFAKGVPGADWRKAYGVLKSQADRGRNGWQGWGRFDVPDPVAGSYKDRGWIPAGAMSCSRSLEYSYNDYCASLVAEGLGELGDAERLRERSRRWIELWNPDEESGGFRGFIAPRNADGSFIGIDPAEVAGSWKGYFYEGSSWTYSAFVPHGFARIVELSGGPAAYAARMDHAFRNGLIEQANEPSFLAARSLVHAGRPDLASYWSRKLMLEGFTERGYPGNDDSGAMSSWYVFTALGLFPNAGQGYYYLTAPLFPKAELALPSGARLVIEAENAGVENHYVQSCALNGKALDRAWIRHDEIAAGGALRFFLGKAPSDWARADKGP